MRRGRNRATSSSPGRPRRRPARQRVLAIEVELSATVDDADVRHLLWLRDKLGDRLLDEVVVTTGPDAYRRADGIGVLPLALLGA